MSAIEPSVDCSELAGYGAHSPQPRGADVSDMGSLDRFQEVETGEAFTLQNSKLLKVELSETTVMAKNGAMVAYQGDVRFEHKGGGLGKFLKKAATGEQLRDRKSTRLNSSHANISYAVF